MTGSSLTLAVCFALCVAPRAAAPQDASDMARDSARAAADSALDACRNAAQAKREADVRPAAELAERRFRALVRSRSADPTPRVGLARTISECRLPFASFLRKGGLMEESNRLLEEALELDSLHWEARYALALNYYHAPDFLGLRDDGIREFERLLAQQGDRAEFPEQAAPYAYLGDLYLRKQRNADALAVWQRGATLFPRDPRLRRRLDRAAAGAESP